MDTVTFEGDNTLEGKMNSALSVIQRRLTEDVLKPVDPDHAEFLGAFEENALSLDEAKFSDLLIDPATGFLMDEGGEDE